MIGFRSKRTELRIPNLIVILRWAGRDRPLCFACSWFPNNGTILWPAKPVHSFSYRAKSQNCWKIEARSAQRVGTKSAPMRKVAGSGVTRKLIAELQTLSLIRWNEDQAKYLGHSRGRRPRVWTHKMVGMGNGL